MRLFKFLLPIRSPRERVGTKLDLDRLRPRPLAAFIVEERPRAGCRPQCLALPIGVWIIDAPIDVLGEHAHWIWGRTE